MDRVPTSFIYPANTEDMHMWIADAKESNEYKRSKDLQMAWAFDVFPYAQRHQTEALVDWGS